jgi:hypothetical protein
MSAIIDFIKRNKVFVSITAAGIVALLALVLVPVIQDAAAVKQSPKSEPTPTATSGRELGNEGEEIVDDGSSAGDVANGDDLEAAKPTYENNGEWSPRAAQAYLPEGEANPVDEDGKPIDWFGTMMVDPTPAVTEFSKQWANPDGGHAAWLARLRPVITDDANDVLGSTAIEAVLPLEFEKVVIEKNAAQLASNFYRFVASYKGCGEVLEGTAQPQPDGSWLVNTVGEAVQSTPETRGNGCIS